MNMKKLLRAAEIAIGTGLYFFDQQQQLSVRDRRKRGHEQMNDLRDRASDFRDRAKGVYESAANRLENMNDALHDDGSSRFLLKTAGFLVGVGVGVGVALLFAPASGEEVRTRIADKAQEFGDNVRQRFGPQATLPATGD